MSDEGLINVEDETPAPVPEAAAPVAAAPEVPAEPPAEPAAAEVDAVEVGGQKYVPVAALIAERGKRQGLAEKAARADELETYVRDSKPYVEFLKANPGILQRQQQAPAPAAPQVETVDPATEQLAKTLDLYTPEGKPDVARAGTIRQMITSTAQQVAQQTIAPMQRESDETKSARNYQAALSIKDQQGRSPSPASLAQIWRTMPPSQTADPNVASILALTALGLDSVHVKLPPQPPAAPPLVTEGPGGAGRRPALSALEASIARDRGIPEAKWAEHTKGFVAGRTQQLED